MPLNTKSYEQFLSDQVSGYAAGVNIDPNLKDGNVILALLQAITRGGDLFLQGQAKQNYIYARATTAEGEDLDSWMAQFGLIREPSTQAEGTVTFAVNQVQSRNILIQPGVVVQTPGGTIQYQVIADSTKAGWSSSSNAYILTAGALNVDCTVQALTAGSSSNVQADQLIQLAGSAAGINTVMNHAPILNGDDPETDAEFRERFILGFNSINANGTLSAFLFAATNVQQGLNISLVEGFDHQGNPRAGFVMVVVDDGSGAPPQSLLDSIYVAIDRIRGAGIEFEVFGPVLTHVTVSLNIRIATGASSANVTLNVENAILDFINGLKIGAILYISQIEKVAMNADPAVVAIQPSSLVCAQADQTPGNRTVYRTDNTRVTIGTY